MTRALVVAAAAVAGASAVQGVEVPEFFDTRTKWYGCGLSTLNQGQCGSCWAVSAAGVFGERLCVHFDDAGNALDPEAGFTGNRLFQKAGTCTGEGTTHMAHNHGCKRTQMFVSPQPLMSCGTFEQDKALYPDSAGCNGGEALDAWRYFFVHGLSEMTADGAAGCTPYTAGKCSGKDPKNNGCRTCSGVAEECEDTGLAPKTHRVSSYGWIMEKGLSARNYTGVPRPESDMPLMAEQIRKMQVELMTNGPLHVCIDYFANFGGFFNQQPLGIYNQTEKLPKAGGHCLSILGWGTDAQAGMDYWLIKNSWGPEWGSEGVFRFLRGVDLCGVESDVWVGCPEGSKCELTDGVVHYETRRPPGPPNAALEARIAEISGNLRRLDDSEDGETSQDPSQPSRGGYWHELSREEFSSMPFAVHVAHAYEAVYGVPTSPEAAAAKAERVWTQGGVHGFKVRVQFPESDADKSDCTHHHRADGAIIRVD